MRSLLLLLAGCTEEPRELLDPGAPVDEHWPLAGDQLPPPTLDLEINLLRVYGLVTFTVSGANPGDVVRIGMSRGAPVAGPCPVALGGECLGIEAPVTVQGRMRANGGGVASHTMAVPYQPNADLCFQAASSAYDQVSDVVCRTIHPELTSQHGPWDSQDIWTTSVYSYAPGGGGPGGGLDEDLLKIGGWGDEYRALVKFDLEGLPTTASSAVIHLWAASTQGGGATPASIDYLTSAWDWKNTGTGSDRLRLWWADRPSYVNLQGPTGTQIGTWFSVDITSLYNDWQGGTKANEGIQLRPASTGNQWVFFASSQTALGVDYRPKLEVAP